MPESTATQPQLHGASNHALGIAARERGGAIDHIARLEARIDAGLGWTGDKRKPGDPIRVSVSAFRPYVSRVPPRKDPRFEHHTPEGFCVVNKREEERRYAKEEGLEWS